MTNTICGLPCSFKLAYLDLVIFDCLTSEAYHIFCMYLVIKTSCGLKLQSIAVTTFSGSYFIFNLVHMKL